MNFYGPPGFSDEFNDPAYRVYFSNNQNVHVYMFGGQQGGPQQQQQQQQQLLQMTTPQLPQANFQGATSGAAGMGSNVVSRNASSGGHPLAINSAPFGVSEGHSTPSFRSLSQCPHHHGGGGYYPGHSGGFYHHPVPVQPQPQPQLSWGGVRQIEHHVRSDPRHHGQGQVLALTRNASSENMMTGIRSSQTFGPGPATASSFSDIGGSRSASALSHHHHNHSVQSQPRHSFQGGFGGSTSTVGMEAPLNLDSSAWNQARKPLSTLRSSSSDESSQGSVVQDFMEGEDEVDYY